MLIPNLIDIHAHVNFNAFKEDYNEVIQKTLDQKVGMILVGSQIDTSERAVLFANKYSEGVWAAIGLHPVHLTEGYWDHKEIGASKGMILKGFKSRKEEFNYDEYYKIGADKKTVAIGECGLDYFRLEANLDVRPAGEAGLMSIKELQQDAFRKQIGLARELKKPLIIHCRPSGVVQGKRPAGTSLTDAYDDVLKILKEEKASEIGGDIHFFVGAWEIAQKFLDLGFYLSFTGVITFSNQYDEVIKNMPLDRIMIETDAPYVAPSPYRGKRNEPLYVAEVAKRIAELRGISYDEVADITTKNAIQLFNLKINAL